jgi:tRNA-2-methylthio-N6-dimethylallyladenosine synthase
VAKKGLRPSIHQEKQPIPFVEWCLIAHFFRFSKSAMAKKVFIKTFGCQMNEYDSDKMADVMRAAEGYEPTTDVDEADLILFNTCSVREKAQEKVFSDLGRVQHLKKKGVLIGVGGCVASQEGADHQACALCGRGVRPADAAPPARVAGIPRRPSKSAVDISFPEIEKFDHLPPARVEGGAAFVSIMEGCSKYCSFCVVPYTRGEEVSRPFDDVLVELPAWPPRREGSHAARARTSTPTAARWAAPATSPTSPC